MLHSAANYPSTAETLTRVSRMQGSPFIRLGSIVMREDAIPLMLRGQPRPPG